MSEFINGLLISLAISIPLGVILLWLRVVVMLKMEQYEPAPPRTPIGRSRTGDYTVD